MQPEVDRSGRVVLGHEACVNCGESSQRSHPAGVIVGGNWFCSLCRTWQLLFARWWATDKEDAREASA